MRKQVRKSKKGGEKEDRKDRRKIGGKKKITKGAKTQTTFSPIPRNAMLSPISDLLV